MGPYAQGKNPVDHRLAEVIEAELGSLNGSGNGKVLPKFYVPKAVAWLQAAQLTRWDACFAQTWKRTMAITNENSNPPNIQRLLICSPPSLLHVTLDHPQNISELSMGSKGAEEVSLARRSW